MGGKSPIGGVHIYPHGCAPYAQYGENTHVGVDFTLSSGNFLWDQQPAV